jgi:hypothetical protein
MAEREGRVEYTLFGKNLYSTSIFSEKWRWARQDLNLRPTGYEPVAPPV